MAKKNSLSTRPNIVAELGPGDSLGIGLMALLLGAEKYYAFDLVHYASKKNNLIMLDELALLLKQKEDIPDDEEFPGVYPKLENYNFPNKIYSTKDLQIFLSVKRISQIKESIINNNNMIQYKAPWFEKSKIIKESIDMIISQAVLEHIDNLSDVYIAMDKWLNPNGFMSHTIDFRCHTTTETWDGHWKLSDLHWFLVRGARTYLINREPFSTHYKLIIENNLNLHCVVRNIEEPTFPDTKLNPRFSSMSKEDRKTSGVFVQINKL